MFLKLTFKDSGLVVWVNMGCVTHIVAWDKSGEQAGSVLFVGPDAEDAIQSEESPEQIMAMMEAKSCK